MNPTAAAHDRQFCAWLGEHRGIFVKIARAYASEPEDQRDLLQEMQLQVWRSLGSFRGQAQPSTWIYRVCLNTALAWCRAERRQPSSSADAPELPTEIPSDEGRPGHSHEKAELLLQLYAAIRQLAPAERSLVLLLLDGLSYREISEITGLTENHVGVALTRARGRLAEKLKGIRDELG